MKNITTLILLCYTTFLISQNKTYIIVNDNNNLPIEYCNVKIVNKDVGTYSNSNGYFTLKVNVVDSLFISHLLYKEITLSVKSINDTIKLQSKNQFLDEIIINSLVNYKEWSKKRKDKHQWFIQPKTEFSVLLKKNEKNETLSEIRFPIHFLDYLKDNNINSSVFRLNLYNNNNGVIGNKINIGNIISKINEKSDFIQFSLEETIKIPKKGYFIGIEFIGFEDINHKILTNQRNVFLKLDFASTKSSSTYYINKFINEGKWSLLEKKNEVFPFELKSGLSLIYIYK